MKISAKNSIITAILGLAAAGGIYVAVSKVEPIGEPKPLPSVKEVVVTENTVKNPAYSFELEGKKYLVKWENRIDQFGMTDMTLFLNIGGKKIWIPKSYKTVDVTEDFLYEEAEKEITRITNEN